MFLLDGESTESRANPIRSGDQIKLLCCYQVRKSPAGEVALD
jgi:hypothetical protein